MLIFCDLLLCCRNRQGPALAVQTRVFWERREQLQVSTNLSTQVTRTIYGYKPSASYDFVSQNWRPFAVDEDKNTCTVAIVADYEFFTNVGNSQESTVRLTNQYTKSGSIIQCHACHSVLIILCHGILSTYADYWGNDTTYHEGRWYLQVHVAITCQIS